jgi:membrane dipeptidase
MDTPLVLDSLTPFYTLDPPWPERLLASSIGAVFLSVVSDAGWDRTLARVDEAHRKIAASPHLDLALSAADVENARASGRIAVVLVTQAADMVERRLERVALLHRLGIRILGLCYTFANLYGDGCGELRDAGLTFLGRELIAAVNELPMLLDVSHSGHRTTEEAIELARRPCVTHASAHAVEANDRNKTDAAIRALAAKGGVIGACALPRAVRAHDPSLDHFLDHIEYMVGLVGGKHVGIGLDFTEGYQAAGEILPQSRRNRTLRPDIFGTVEDFLIQRYPAGIAGIADVPNLVEGLRGRFDDDTVRVILGGSWMRALHGLDSEAHP